MAVKRRGASVLLISGRRILLLKRSTSSGNPGTWGLPGGGKDKGETADMAARREALEEMSTLPEYEVCGEIKVACGKWRYRVFLYRSRKKAKKTWSPGLNHEHTKHIWRDLKWCLRHRRKLHPVLRLLLKDKAALRRIRAVMKGEDDSTRTAGTIETADLISAQEILLGSSREYDDFWEYSVINDDHRLTHLIEHVVPRLFDIHQDTPPEFPRRWAQAPDFRREQADKVFDHFLRVADFYQPWISLIRKNEGWPLALPEQADEIRQKVKELREWATCPTAAEVIEEVEHDRFVEAQRKVYDLCLGLTRELAELTRLPYTTKYNVARDPRPILVRKGLRSTLWTYSKSRKTWVSHDQPGVTLSFYEIQKSAKANQRALDQEESAYYKIAASLSSEQRGVLGLLSDTNEWLIKPRYQRAFDQIRMAGLADVNLQGRGLITPLGRKVEVAALDLHGHPVLIGDDGYLVARTYEGNYVRVDDLQQQVSEFLRPPWLRHHDVDYVRRSSRADLRLLHDFDQDPDRFEDKHLGDLLWLLHKAIEDTEAEYEDDLKTLAVAFQASPFILRRNLPRIQEDSIDRAEHEGRIAMRAYNYVAVNLPAVDPEKFEPFLTLDQARAVVPDFGRVIHEDVKLPWDVNALGSVLKFEAARMLASGIPHSEASRFYYVRSASGAGATALGVTDSTRVIPLQGEGDAILPNASYLRPKYGEGHLILILRQFDVKLANSYGRTLALLGSKVIVAAWKNGRTVARLFYKG